MKNVHKWVLIGTIAILGAWSFSAQAQEDKVAESSSKTADAAIQMLDKEGDFSLQDMNQAQDAVVRLNYMAEIEKKLTEIDNARKMREGAGFMGATAPAPGPLPPMGGTAADNFGNEMTYSVARVFGANGAYSAVLTSGTGKSIIAKQGDVLPNGSRVKSITMTGVRVKDSYGESNLPFAGEMRPRTSLFGADSGLSDSARP